MFAINVTVISDRIHPMKERMPSIKRIVNITIRATAIKPTTLLILLLLTGLGLLVVLISIPPCAKLA
jgi:hypothetical protein